MWFLIYLIHVGRAHTRKIRVPHDVCEVISHGYKFPQSEKYECDILKIDVRVHIADVLVKLDYQFTMKQM